MTTAPTRTEGPRERATRDALLPAAIEAAKRGDERAFMLLYHSRAHAVAACVCLAIPDEELRRTTQNVFRRVWRALPDCQADDAVEFDAWLLEELGAIVSGRRGDTPTASVDVWGLPVALRDTVLLREVFGHGLDQIARVLDQPVDTIRLWYRRGLEGLAA